MVSKANSFRATCKTLMKDKEEKRNLSPSAEH
jgi:hypothetical protein